MKTTNKMRPKEDQNFWNFVFSIVFLAAVIAALVLLAHLPNGFPTTLSVFDFTLIVLASFRITRLVVYDKVTRFFREFFVQKKEVTHDGKEYVEIIHYTKGIRATIHELLNCPWCIGMWSALITTFFYFEFSWSWYVLLFLAIAGLSSFIQILANLIGWEAQNLKHEALEKE